MIKFHLRNCPAFKKNILKTKDIKSNESEHSNAKNKSIRELTRKEEILKNSAMKAQIIFNDSLRW